MSISFRTRKYSSIDACREASLREAGKLDQEDVVSAGFQHELAVSQNLCPSLLSAQMGKLQARTEAGRVAYVILRRDFQATRLRFPLV